MTEEQIEAARVPKEDIMALLNGQGVVAPNAAAKPATPAAGGKPTAEEKKAKRLARRQEKYNAAMLLVTSLKKANVAFTPEMQSAADLLTRQPRVGGGGGFGGEPIFNKIFGAAPQVNQSVTINEVFAKTFKGVAQMNALVRKWATKNVAIVEYNHNEAEPFKSTYTIKSLGGAKA